MSSMSISRLVGCLHGRVSRGLGQFRAVLGKEVLLALFGSKFSHEILKAQVTSWASMVEKKQVSPSPSVCGRPQPPPLAT